jgi:hypothetical protein
MAVFEVEDEWPVVAQLLHKKTMLNEPDQSHCLMGSRYYVMICSLSSELKKENNFSCPRTLKITKKTKKNKEFQTPCSIRLSTHPPIFKTIS